MEKEEIEKVIKDLPDEITGRVVGSLHDNFLIMDFFINKQVLLYPNAFRDIEKFIKRKFKKKTGLPLSKIEIYYDYNVNLLKKKNKRSGKNN